MNLSPIPVLKFFDNAGKPLNGGLLFTYAAGTSTKLATFQNQAGTPNTNPIVLDFRGEANIWLDPLLSYKFVLAPSTDTDPPTNPIWSVDNISLYGGLTADMIGSLIWPKSPAEIAGGVSIIHYGFQWGDVRRYGAIGNGSIAGNTGTDDSAAFVAASASGHRIIVDGELIYRISSSPTLTAAFYIGANTTVSMDTGATLTLSGPAQIVSTVPFYGPGVVHYSTTGSRPARVVNILPDRAAGVPVRGGCQYQAYGDSYTAGTGVTAVTRFPALVASRFNMVENNHGVGGRGVTRALLEAFQTLPKWGVRSQFITYMAGFNDLHYGGSNPKTLVKLTSEMQAFLANAFLKTAVAADDASVTKTGAWSNATAGTWADKGSQSLGGHAMFSGTNTNKISWTFTGTNVVVGTWQNLAGVNTLATFDVYIDSVFVESLAPNNTTDGNVGFPEVYENMTHMVLLYTTLGGGAHTIELRQTSANTLPVDYFGTLASPGDCPSVVVSEIPHVNAAGYAGPESLRSKTIDDAGSAALRTALVVFQILGYPVAWVPVNDYYDYQANIQGDNDHPNVIGHQQIASALSSYCFGNNYNVQPSCTFNKAATQAITTATLTAVTFSSATDDLFGFRDASNTSRIYAPMTGTLRIEGIISWASSGVGLRDGNVYLNGSGVSSGYLYGGAGVAGIDNGFPFIVDIPVAAGDYAEIKVSQNSGGNLNIQTNTRVSAMMIR